LRELELRQLARELLSSDLSPTLASLKGKIKSYTDGRLSHAEHILPALYELMESNESVVEPPLPALEPSNEEGATGGYLDGLKRALADSLTSGTFLDSQFYAVDSRSSTGLPKIRPVYYCSAVGGSFTSKLTACEILRARFGATVADSSFYVDSSKLREWKTPPPVFVDGYDSDVDDEESDPEVSTERYPCWTWFVGPLPIHNYVAHFASSSVRENPTRADLPMEPALLFKSGAAKT